MLEKLGERGGAGGKEGEAAVDRSSNIRNPSRRTLRALGVGGSKAALEEIAQALGGFLEEALQVFLFEIFFWTWP